MSENNIRKDIRRYLGSKTLLDVVSEYKIDKILEEINFKYTPRHIYGLYDILIKDAEVSFIGTILKVKSHDLSKVLKDSKKCIIIACTLGIEIEKQLKQCGHGDLENAILYDAVAAAYIENYLDDITINLSNQYLEKDYHTTRRYSPGYGDLSLEVQPKIIDLLQAQKRIGLTVNENHLLIPRKSITAFIGLQEKPYKQLKNKCETCEIRNICKIRKGDKDCGTN